MGIVWEQRRQLDLTQTLRFFSRLIPLVARRSAPLLLPYLDFEPHGPSHDETQLNGRFTLPRAGKDMWMDRLMAELMNAEVGCG
uniref:Uncharacterized protein n=1 Tax=Physcomitrium patens TaxID=3218 RepID=A0A2K1IF37_PHYPA|nr:hypothetical protein PHYPA_028484 [Physcomitrium patens]